MRQLPVRRRVLREVGIEKEDREHGTAQARHIASPGPQLDRPPLEHDAGLHPGVDDEVVHPPVHRFLGLPARRVQALVEVALAMEQRHADHR